MKKLLNKKGFTLMEMLIVVAIIVILVAISIPTFSSQLDNAKAATDDANFRAAKGVAEVADMTADGWKTIIGSTYNAETEYVLTYDIDAGTYVVSYSGEAYGSSSDHKGQVIRLTIDEGAITVEPDWVAK